MSKCYNMQILVKIKLLVQEILSIISFFLYILSVLLYAVTFKIRSKSQCSNQGFSMSKCYINANFGQNKIISSGDIEHNITFLSEFSVFCLQ